MKIMQGLHHLRKLDQEAVVTIGNFDGVHLGHQSILKQVKYLSFRKETPSMVVVFEPPPQLFFNKKIVRLNALRDKILEFRAYEMDKVLVIPFNKKIAKLTADEFVKIVLIDQLKISALVVGDDFHLGSDQKGFCDYLKEASSRYHFDLRENVTVEAQGQRVSSTWIRDCLQKDELNQAEILLGHPYRLCGRVVKGDGRGKTLGFPTANLHIKLDSLPLHGVYAVRVDGLSSGLVLGLANVGVRPTIGGEHTLVEVHLLNFSQEIYGRFIRLEFIKKFRDEKKFNSLDQLKKQIKEDVEIATDFFQINQ